MSAKTITDFLSSLASGRLYDQIRRLSRAYPRRYLLIEGLIDWNTLTNPGWFCSALQRIVLIGVPVLFSQSPEDSARLIGRIAHIQRGMVPLPKTLMTKSKVTDKQLRVLCAFPGIGEKRSRILLSSFGSLRKVFLATKKELRKKGIGRKTAKEIHNITCMEYFEASRPKELST